MTRAFVAIMLAFFVAAALFVRLCDHIIGEEEDALSSTDAGTRPADEPVAA